MKASFSLFLLFPILNLALLSSCGKSDPVEPDEPKPKPKAQKPPKKNAKVIGVATRKKDDSSFESVSEALKTGATEHGFKVSFQPDDGNPGSQLEQVQELIAQKVSAIVVFDDDSEDFDLAIQEANQAKIPVFTFESRTKPTFGKIVSRIGPNHYQSGELAGRAMIEALGETSGEILILDFSADDGSLDRIRGFKNVINRFNSSRPEGKMEIVEERLESGVQEVSPATIEAVLKDQAEVVGILAMGTDSGLGAVSALEKVGRQDQVTVIGFCGDREGKKAVLNGKYYAGLVQDSAEMVTQTMQSIADHLAGEKVAPVQLIDTKLYRKADAASDPDLK